VFNYHYHLLSLSTLPSEIQLVVFVYALCHILMVALPYSAKDLLIDMYMGLSLDSPFDQRY
jgi:hypothetical protein